jgi:RNA polymerase sigma-70 factor (ECF subfamily)
LDTFIAAAQRGDLAALEGLFASDIVSYSDGGGVVRAAQKPVQGRDRVAKFIAAVSSHFWTGVTLSRIEANGQSCVRISRDDGVGALATISASAEGIDQIMWFMRPSKLLAISLARQRLQKGYTPESDVG